ncbi:MAG: hypothetical protein AAF552_02520 [Pseudomonadota bacterium]
MAERHQIFGPVVSSSDLDWHLGLFTEVFGLALTHEYPLDSATLLRAWGVTGEGARVAVLQTPDSGYGVQLIEFAPRSDATIRHRSRGLVPGAAKVIDFFVTDLEPALERAREYGLTINDEIASYDSPEGPVREAHAWVRDEVVCAMIEPPPAMVDRFSSGLGRPVSEPQSISGPTLALEESAVYFRRVLGFDVIYEYEVKDSNFGKMIGSDEPVHIRAKNIGWNLKAPYIGMIDYGLAKPGDETINPVVPPVRGLLGVTVCVSGLQAVVHEAEKTGSVVVPLARQAGVRGPWSGTDSAVVRAPNGMLLQLVGEG